MSSQYRGGRNRSWTRVTDCQRLGSTGKSREKRAGRDERVRRKERFFIAGHVRLRHRRRRHRGLLQRDHWGNNVVGPGGPVLVEHGTMVGRGRRQRWVRYRLATDEFGDPQRGAGT